MFSSARCALLFIVVCWVPPLPGQAAEPAVSLTQQINQLINQQRLTAPDANITQQVTILTPQEQLSGLCAMPQLSLIGGSARLTGNRTVLAQCGQQRKFIQIGIDAQGSWFISRRAIAVNTLVQPSDIEKKTGSFKHLPAGILLSPTQIVGHVATRNIPPGQPLVQGQLRKRWRIHRGQQVDIKLIGSGFLIRTSGIALDHAATGDTLRARTRSGKIISGVITAEGDIHINIDE